MNAWFYLNLMTFLYALLYFLWRLPTSVSLFFALTFGLLGLLFILLNWNMHALFSKIRKLTSRKKRIQIAKHARKIMPYHIHIGILALVFVLAHLLLINDLYSFSWHLKTVSGYGAFIGLIIVLFSGWLRRIRASRKNRLFHLYTSFFLFLLIVWHLVL